MKHKLESRLPGEISTTSDVQMIPLQWQIVKLESLLIRVKENEKTGLKLNIQRTTIVASGPITSWQVKGGKKWKSDRFIFLGSKITVDSDCIHGFSLEGKP